jgi:hypothetical protein
MSLQGAGGTCGLPRFALRAGPQPSMSGALQVATSTSLEDRGETPELSAEQGAQRGQSDVHAALLSWKAGRPNRRSRRNRGRRRGRLRKWRRAGRCGRTGRHLPLCYRGDSMLVALPWPPVSGFRGLGARLTVADVTASHQKERSGPERRGCLMAKGSELCARRDVSSTRYRLAS